MTQAVKPRKETARAEPGGAVTAASRQALQALLRTALPEVTVAQQTPEELSSLLTQAHLSRSQQREPSRSSALERRWHNSIP